MDVLKVREGRRFDTFSCFFVLTPDGVSSEYYETMNLNLICDYPNDIRIHDIHLGATGRGASSIESMFGIGTIIDQNGVAILPKTIGANTTPLPVGNITAASFINTIRWNVSDKLEYRFINGSALCRGIQMQRIAFRTSRVLPVGDTISFQLAVEFEIPIE